MPLCEWCMKEVGHQHQFLFLENKQAFQANTFVCDVMPVRMIERDLIFCGVKCLAEWCNTRKEVGF